MSVINVITVMLVIIAKIHVFQWIAMIAKDVMALRIAVAVTVVSIVNHAKTVLI